MSSPRTWVRRIANIPTDNGDLVIGAQFYVKGDGTETRTLLVNDRHGVDIADVPALLEAIAAAVDALNAA